MSQEHIFEGGCLCGAIRYRATTAPIRGVICHCSMCRKHSGAPALAFVHFPVHAFTWTHGEPARYRSSAIAERGFCRECGSTVSMHERVLVCCPMNNMQFCVPPRFSCKAWVKSHSPAMA